jgi:YVTN family beta-propeller protein
MLGLGVALMVLMAAPEAAGTEPAKGGGGVLLVANKGDQTLGIIDPGTGRQVATVKQSGITGHEVTASPDGKLAYVPIYGNAGVGRPGTDGRSVDVIDIAARKLVATIDLGKGERPHDPKFGPDGMLYVSTELSNTITVIDPATRKIVRTLPTGQPEAHMLLVTRDGKKAFTANVGVGTVSAIDVKEARVLAVVPLSSKVQRLAFDRDEKRLFTADQAAPRLAVLSTETHALLQWVDLPGIAYGTAATPDGRYLVMALIGMNKVGILDLQTLKVARTIDVPKAPQEVVVRPDGKVAYVSCDASHQVAAIDLDDWKVTLIEAGPVADGLAWANTP